MSSFKDYGFKEEILKALDDLGFEKPSPIQEKAFEQLISSEQDLIAMAQTGTGKTAAFSLPILNEIDVDIQKPQVIILSPTRELCLQITQNIEDYSKYMKNTRVQAVYGGADIEKQIRGIKKKPQIIVGTPGRTLDLINRKRLDLSEIQWLVLDEADEMLSMGFKDDLDAILSGTSDYKQTLLFSATMPKEAQSLASKYMLNPAEIKVSPEKNIGNKNVTHQYYIVNARDRYIALKRLVDFAPNIYGIIFCRTKRETKDIADQLMQEGYLADAIHGDLSQAQRDYVMKRFRNKSLQILVATDVAARGIDVNELTHVINYNLPDEDEVYVHRSGRTGRAGNEGICATIITNREVGKIRSIERKVGKMKKEDIPTGKQICEKQLFNTIHKISKIEINHKEIDEYLPAIYEELQEMSREELLQRLVSLEFNRFLDFYKGSHDINVDEKAVKDRNSKNGFTRFFINVGKKDQMNPRELLTLINQNIKVRNIEIGSIDLLDSFSFFEADSAHKDEILDSMNRVQYRGSRVSVEEAQQKSRSGKSRGRSRGSFKGHRKGNGSGRRNSGKSGGRGRR
ncbi:MAG: DEAD/DEAH box helicase [Flavobacteriales bacterium]